MFAVSSLLLFVSLENKCLHLKVRSLGVIRCSFLWKPTTSPSVSLWQYPEFWPLLTISIAAMSSNPPSVCWTMAIVSFLVSLEPLQFILCTAARMILLNNKSDYVSPITQNLNDCLPQNKCEGFWLKPTRHPSTTPCQIHETFWRRRGKEREGWTATSAPTSSHLRLCTSSSLGLESSAQSMASLSPYLLRSLCSSINLSQRLSLTSVCEVTHIYYSYMPALPDFFPAHTRTYYIPILYCLSPST